MPLALWVLRLSILLRSQVAGCLLVPAPAIDYATVRRERKGSGLNTVRLAVWAEPVEAHSPFDRLRANELKRTALGQVLQ